MKAQATLVAPLFVPADRPERFAKAAASGADAVIVDLEDAVAADRKEVGREALVAALSLRVPVYVRVNAPGTPWHEADLTALRELPFDRIMVPKVEKPETIGGLETRLGAGRIFIALIESARGLANARAIAAHPRVAQLAFGPADYGADLGTVLSEEAMGFALSSLVMASRAEGLPAPLDGPSFDLSEASAGLEAELARRIPLGIGGKLCIHPRQVEWVRRRFSPSTDDLAWARGILAEGDGLGARKVNGRLVDKPVVQLAQSILARAGTANAG